MKETSVTQTNQVIAKISVGTLSSDTQARFTGTQEGLPFILGRLRTSGDTGTTAVRHHSPLQEKQPASDEYKRKRYIEGITQSLVLI